MTFAKAKHNGTEISTAKANLISGYKLMLLIAIATSIITGAWIMYAVKAPADIALLTFPCRLRYFRDKNRSAMIIATPVNCSQTARARHCQ